MLRSMGLLSILLSGLAIVCAGIGVLTTPFPVLGLIFAFGAPALAVAGVMLGGSAMSKAKRAGQTNDIAKIGVILNAIAFVPSLLVALTCGVCNALFSTGNMQVQRDIRFGTSPFGAADGGVRALPPPQRSAKPDPDATGKPTEGDDPGASEPSRPGSEPPPSGLRPADRQPPDGQPPPPSNTLPPPPLPPGPGK